MSVNILMIGVHTWRNLGDQALSRAALAQLHHNFPTAKITVAVTDLQSFEGNDPIVPSIFHWVTQASKRQALRLAWLILVSLCIAFIYRLTGKKLLGIAPSRLRNTFEAYLQADLIVCNPGGYFFSYGSGSIFLIIAFSMALPTLLGKPMYIFPQSFGPFQRTWEKNLARWILSRARLVMAREPISLETLQSLKIPSERYKLLPDTAFTFRGETAEAAQIWLKEHQINLNSDRPLLGLTVMDWKIQKASFTGQDQYEAALEAAIRHFATEYAGKILLFPQTSGPSVYEDDRLVTQRLAERLGDLDKTLLVIDEPLSPGLLQAVLGQLDVFIGTRMHSNIFALNQGVPVIAIGYMHKTRGIARSLGIEEWVIDIHQVDAPSLITLLDQLWKKRPQVHNHLVQKIPFIVEQAEQAGKLVAADYFSSQLKMHPNPSENK